MGLRTTVTVTANKDAAQVYFPKPLAADSRFPFEQGETVGAVIVPSGAVLLYPTDPSWSWPLSVPDPDRIVHETDQTHTHADDSPFTNP